MAIKVGVKKTITPIQSLFAKVVMVPLLGHIFTHESIPSFTLLQYQFITILHCYTFPILHSYTLALSRPIYEPEVKKRTYKHLYVLPNSYVHSYVRSFVFPNLYVLPNSYMRSYMLPNSYVRKVTIICFFF